MDLFARIHNFAAKKTENVTSDRPHYYTTNYRLSMKQVVSILCMLLGSILFWACGDDSEDVQKPEPLFVVRASPSPENAGIVELYIDDKKLNSPYSTEKAGTDVTVKAIANQDYKFVKWTNEDRTISEDSEYHFKVESDMKLIAHFEEAIPALRETIRLSSCSLEDGTVVSPISLTEIILTYDQNVVVSSMTNVTLNDQECTVGSSQGSKRKVIITLPALAEKTNYKLTIPAGTVLGADNANTTAPEYSISFSTSVTPETNLTNPKATIEAQNVYNYLLSIYGKKQLSGVQSWMSNKNDFSSLVYNATHKHPALAGYDFLYLAFSPTPENWGWQQNYNDISAAKEQWDNNGLVNYMWHWNVPNSEADYNNCVNKDATDNMGFYCPGANGGSGETSFDIREALKEGTWQNACIMRDIEEVAGYLKLLQEAKIPVIFRPLHEAAGNYTRYNPAGGSWFWWGRYGAQYCRQLYRLLYNQLVNVYGLNNLIWVWTIDAAPGFEQAAKDWYPGDDMVDIVGVDIYTDDNLLPQTTQYNFMQEITGGKKMCTISECGNILEPSAQFGHNLNWLWFMVWPSSETSITGTYSKNTVTYWKQVVDNEYILNREDMPSLK